ncbi:MAG: tRNA (adenosine(37)-N6)-dimethylallyltransferase MiaA [Desulfitobacterium hafniense]|nr:tRNA (adenosine(37)-N6)-dimethylallyltransferase MiaA [Desulfitobacterium hafniense]
MHPLIVIVGPTAVGKTALGISLAKVLNGEIISGDSVQVYKKLDIGSAKPSISEREGIPHHLIDVLDPSEPFTVAQFQEITTNLIKEIKARGRTPILVGGTGLYVRSILDPFDFLESGSDDIRNKWTEYLDRNGKVNLHEALTERDPISAERLHPNDTIRIIRALEVFDLTGIPLSAQRQTNDRKYTPLGPSVIYIGLTAPREIIYRRINARCEEMVGMGLLQETLDLINQGYSPSLKPLQSIGYRHAVWHLIGKVTIDEMLRLLKRDTRHFAKRQLTWFHRDPRIIWYDITKLSIEQIVNSIYQTCRGVQTRVE